VKPADDLQINLLGDLRLIRHGRNLALPPSKKTRALLAYLIATGHPHLRARLCDLLWDGPNDPRAALRWSLAKLRPLLDADGAERLLADRERVAFAVHGANVDIIRLAALASGGLPQASTEELRHAAALFSGEFADGLDLPACMRFHEWCSAEREKWATLRMAILTALVERLDDAPEAALVYARGRVAIDPLDENGHVIVVRLLTALGRQREALRQYEYCRQILEAELGTQPGASLQNALSTAKAATKGAAKAADPGQAADMPGITLAGITLANVNSTGTPPRATEAALIGRARECAALDTVVAAVAGPGARGKLVLLNGAPGIGKTRLLLHLEQSITAVGGRVAAARAFEAEMLRPYGIWADLLGTIPQTDMPAAVRAALQPLILGAANAPTAVEGDRARLFAAFVSLLQDLTLRTPVAILIDDLQWADESSIALLHYVLRAFDAPCRVVLAAAARSGDIVDNAPAQRLLRGLARDRRLSTIAVGPLDAQASATLAKSAAPGSNVASVVAASEGNPLFVLELARALARGDDAVPESIEGVLADHLARPEGPARMLLPWAAAFGREFDTAILARCVRLSPAAWDEALAELERRSIIRSISEVRYDFAHDLIRKAAYGRISQPRRRLIHGQIARSMAAVLDENRGEPIVAGELARHAELGGDPVLAARGCVSGGEHAMRVFANDEATGFALRGLYNLEHVRAGSDRARLCISLLGIQILASSGNRLRRWPHLLGTLSAAVAVAEAAGLQAEAATGYHLLSILHQDEGDDALAQASTLRAAEVGRHADMATAAGQLANTARCLIELELDIGRSRLLVAEAGARLDQSNRKAIELFWSQALLDRWDGALDTAAPLMLEALQLAREQQDRWRECKCLIWLAAIHFERGDPAASLECCDELQPLAAKMGESGETPFVQALGALSRRVLCLPDSANGLRMATEQLRAFDSKAHLAYILNATAEIAFEAGDCAEACAAAQDALVAAEATRRVCEAVTSRALLARIFADQGDASGARDWLDPVLARVVQPDGLSARARSAGLRAATALGLRLPTLDQTLS
jgi:DNA-binding SARP family transcriptional activator